MCHGLRWNLGDGALPGDACCRSGPTGEHRPRSGPCRLGEPLGGRCHESAHWRRSTGDARIGAGRADLAYRRRNQRLLDHAAIRQRTRDHEGWVGWRRPYRARRGPRFPTAIAIDDTNVYWTEYDASALMAVPLGGGASVTLVGGQNMPDHLTV